MIIGKKNFYTGLETYIMDILYVASGTIAEGGNLNCVYVALCHT